MFGTGTKHFLYVIIHNNLYIIYINYIYKYI